ncbi:MAG: hypothetical protein LBD75_07750 [Candidatus Peribacteria bacterium]|nr:hypothetical protein [Candidatus Peribacteria bacterium]
MTNRTAINEGFHQQRTTGYLLSAENVTYLQQCLQPQTWDTEPRGANIITNGMPPRELTAAELFSGNVIQITGTRNADNLLNLPKSAKEQLAQRGRTIVDYTTFNNFSPSEYSKASSNAIGGQEERAIFMQKL